MGLFMNKPPEDIDSADIDKTLLMFNTRPSIKTDGVSELMKQTAKNVLREPLTEKDNDEATSSGEYTKQNTYADKSIKISDKYDRPAVVDEYDTKERIPNSSDNTDSQLIFKVPDWGYQDFIRERTSWQKHYDSATGEPGWFYFKVFFRFDTKNGLLGELLGEEDDYGNLIYDVYTSSHNTAVHYLEMNKDHYTNIDMEGRANALRKFGAILSFINGHAPWFFDSIGGLDKASSPQLSQPLNDHVLELGFMEDAVDMRITNLVDLYKYAVYDYIGMKEVVPENLRQFEMTVVLFHTPLRWYHTGMQTMRRGTFQYKSLSDSNMENRMSYKMYTFKGCEFVLETLGNVYPSEVNNQSAFSLGKGKIGIKYKRVYQHTFNEWGQFMIGDDGVYYDNPTGNSRRLAALEDAAKNPYYFNPGAEIFKPLVDATEARITWMMKQIQPGAVFGNLYKDSTNVNGKYYKNKLKDFKNGKDFNELYPNSKNKHGLYNTDHDKK